MDTKRIAEIMVRDRYRRDLGDLSGLVESIGRLGLLNPVTVSPDGVLIAGERRLRAVEQLGWTDIPVNVVSNITEARESLVAERDENTQRKDLMPSELAALGRVLEELERPKAKERQVEGQSQGREARRSGSSSGDDKPVSRGVKTNGIVGAALGMSETSYHRLRGVAVATEDASLPEPVREAAKEIMADMDRGVTTINGGSTRLREAKAASTTKGTRPVIDLTPRIGKTLDGREYVSVPKPQRGRRKGSYTARRKLEALSDHMEGFISGMHDFELDESVTDGDALRFSRELKTYIAWLRKVRGMLTTRTGEQE